MQKPIEPKPPCEIIKPELRSEPKILETFKAFKEVSEIKINQNYNMQFIIDNLPKNCNLIDVLIKKNNIDWDDNYDHYIPAYFIVYNEEIFDKNDPEYKKAEEEFNYLNKVIAKNIKRYQKEKDSFTIKMKKYNKEIIIYNEKLKEYEIAKAAYEKELVAYTKCNQLEKDTIELARLKKAQARLEKRIKGK